MKPLTLRPHEARHLARYGRCVVIRSVEPQPPFDGAKEIPLDSLDRYETDWGTYDEDREYKCPLGPPGSETWCREACLADGNVGPASKMSNHLVAIEYVADGARQLYETNDSIPLKWVIDAPCKVLPSKMPRWASRFPDLVHAGSRLCRLSQVKPGECEEHGVKWHRGPLRAGHTNHVSAMRSQWDRDNPRHPAAGDPWVWVGTIEKQEGQ